jgi:uncharacterized protein
VRDGIVKRVLLAAACLAAASSAQAVSLDCAKAVAVEERAVCDDPLLSRLDSALDESRPDSPLAWGKKFSADPEWLMKAARFLIAQRRACGAERSCLIATYAGAIEGYAMAQANIALPKEVDALVIANGNEPPSLSAPTRPGQCAPTRVAEITSLPFSTTIHFTNGVAQELYLTPAAIEARPGDDVVMCLIPIPVICGQGNDYASYLTTNLRTHWTSMQRFFSSCF